MELDTVGCDDGEGNKPVLNINVGVLGHVDSGKTSLVKSLSTVASTACFDKNPQSRERGITLDLGFSSFQVPLPDHMRQDDVGGYERLQFTLVDCPGHASLIKTIIGGAQIIDMMMLVIDVTKGMQTQTGECLIIGEITCSKMIVVLNKVDLLPKEKSAATLAKMKTKLQKTLANTRFAGSPIIAVAAKPGGPEAPESQKPEGVAELIEQLTSFASTPDRLHSSGPFILAVDHCFSLRGQGTVLTGTVLSGSLQVNQTVEMPALKISRKVKSMQMFHKPVQKAIQGDRVGVCVTQFDPSLLERGVACSPGALRSLHAAIVSAQPIPHYKGRIATKNKFHISIGHETVTARVTFFAALESRLNASEQPSSTNNSFDLASDYLYAEELPNASASSNAGEPQDPASNSAQEPSEGCQRVRCYYALLEFDRKCTCPDQALYIASRLDTDIHANVCRLAFHGRVLMSLTDKDYSRSVLPQLRAYKTKQREGVAERALDEYTIVGRSLFKKESNMEKFVGLKVRLSTGEGGVIEGGFGQSGKFKVRLPAGISEVTKECLGGIGVGKKKSKDTETNANRQTVKIYLNFKRYVFDPQKVMKQT